MSETISVDQPAPETTLGRLREMRGGLLRLHKTLLDSQRAVYEQVMGRVTSGELLQLVINHEQFVWLRSISEFIVRIDEMLDTDEPVTTNDAESALAHARALLSPSENGDEFGRKYYAALQRDPDAVLAHRAVTRIL
jgi:hypothetical protein